MKKLITPSKRAIAQIVITFLFSLTFAACSEVSTRYDTRKDAEADQLFTGRGWLPRIIPGSSTGIVTANNLDRNTSRGEFYFDAKDHDSFVAKLKRQPSLDSGDLAAYVYKEWTFRVDEAKSYCNYSIK